MSKDCLVTKVKGSSGNNHLPRLNQLSFYSESGETIKVVVGSKTASPVRVDVENGTLYNGQNPVTTPEELSTADGRAAYYRNAVLSAGGRVFIDNKYRLTVIGFPCDMNELSYCTELLVITYNGNIHGSLSSLKNLTKLRVFEIIAENGNPNINGDIAVFANMLNLEKLSMQKLPNVYGKIEDIIAGLIAKGRTSATIKAEGIEWVRKAISDENITFAGENFIANTGYFIWEAASGSDNYTITYKLNSDDSVYATETIHVNSDGTWSIVS